METVEVDLTVGTRLKVLSRNAKPRTVTVRAARTQRGTLTPAQTIEYGRVKKVRAERGEKRDTLLLTDLSAAMRAELHQRYGTTELKPLVERGLISQDEEGRLHLIIRPPCVWWREGDETHELELPPTWS